MFESPKFTRTRTIVLVFLFVLLAISFSVIFAVHFHGSQTKRTAKSWSWRCDRTPQSIRRNVRRRSEVSARDDINATSIVATITASSRNYAAKNLIDLNRWNVKSFPQCFQTLPSNVDFLSFQEVRVPESVWQNDAINVNGRDMYYFHDSDHVFIAASAISIVGNVSGKIFKEEHAYGMILMKKGFLNEHPIVDYGVVYGHHEGEEKKGLVWACLNLDEKNNLFLGSMHGEWNEKYGGYENEKNVDAIAQFFRLKNRNEDVGKNVHHILLGDCNLSYEKMKKLSLRFGFEMEKFPMETSISDGESPDHFAVSENVRIESEPVLCVNQIYDHKWLENLKFNIMNY